MGIIKKWESQRYADAGMLSITQSAGTQQARDHRGGERKGGVSDQDCSSD